MLTVFFQNAIHEIRPIYPDDLDAVLDVYQQCEDFLALGPVDTASISMVEADLEISRRSGGSFCGIYTVEGQMVGVVDYVPDGYEGEPNLAYLALLMIVPSFRKLGLGKAVVEAVEHEIWENEKVTAILAGVQVNNPLAIKFWLRQGYRITGGPELMPDLTTVFHLRKDK